MVARVPDTDPSRPDVVHGIEALGPRHGRLFVVVGVFDGLHLGHAYLLRHLREAATTRAARPAVITFDHHPDEILIGSAPPLLCDPDERLALLDAAGVEVTIVQTFDAALRMTPFQDFVGRLAERVNLAGFLMTPDAAFGHDRLGTPAAVAELGLALGFEVVVVPTMDLDGRAVRSGDIRAAIAAGHLDAASTMLGRAYAVTGTVLQREPLEQALVQFETPVALPPAGEYRAHVGRALREPPTDQRNRLVIVRPDRTIEIASGAWADGVTRARITFGTRTGP